MNIDTGTQKDLDETKTMKVSLPVQQHLQLHALKLLTGKNISDAVEEALDLYLEEEADESVSISTTEDESPEATAS